MSIGPRPAAKPTPGWGAVILAAGASERFGPGPPKALAEAGDRTLVERIAEVAASRGLRPIVLVVGARSEVESGARVGPIDISVPNAEWAKGRTGSVKRGLSALGPARGAVVWPVDVPFVAPGTLDRLLAVAREGGLAIWWTPTYGERGGHPILLAAPAIRQVLDLADDLPLRAAPFRGGLAERRVPVDDPGVLDNVNTRRALLEAEAAWRSRGSE